MFGPDVLVAVRSSGMSEDSAAHSFSGMYSSFLNTPQDQVMQKVKECWASSRFTSTF
jgi:phosphoenolpyruvate synthase/pyruvate phosphate dikinase